MQHVINPVSRNVPVIKLKGQDYGSPAPDEISEGLRRYTPERFGWGSFSSAFAPVVLFLSVNILLLDIIVFSKKNPGITTTRAASEQQSGDTLTPAVTGTTFVSPPITEVPEKPVSPQHVVLPQAREYYIPLGGGKTKSNEWTSLLSAEAYVDTDRYPRIKQAYFEAYLSIPTGNGQVQVKLFNVTQKHDVWFSDVSSIGHEVTRREVPISLEPGNNLYRVMIKASLEYDVLVENARIKIVTE